LGCDTPFNGLPKQEVDFEDNFRSEYPQIKDGQNITEYDPTKHQTVRKPKVRIYCDDYERMGEIRDEETERKDDHNQFALNYVVLCVSPKITTMRKFTLFIAACLIMASLFVNPGYAQESEDPGLVLVMEEFVAPSDMPQFWKVQSEAMELFDKMNFDLKFWTYRTDHNSFYWAVPLKNFAAIDEFYTKSMEFHQQLIENGYDPAAKFRDLSNISQFVVRWNKDLSFRKTERAEGAEPDKFYEWMFIYLKSGHEKEAADACQKYIDFYKGIEEDYPWDMYEVVFGEHTPCWIMEVSAESEALLREKEEGLQKKYNEDFMKLWQNMVPHVRDIKSQKGWFLPRWSKYSNN